METKELKILLKLLGCEGYSGKVADVKPTSKATVAETEKWCRKLCDRSFLDLTEEIAKFKIAPPGKTLLKADLDNLPLSDDDLKVLKACENKTIRPSETGLKAAGRQEVLQGLSDRGFIKAVETKILKVTLSPQGKYFLRDEYFDNNARRNLQLSAALLTNYLQFMRSGLSAKNLTEASDRDNFNLAPNTQIAHKPSDAELIEILQDIDRKLPTDNYIPIYELRDRVQPPMSREEVDNTLYRLEREDKLQLSSLQEGMNYTEEQLAAGIPQSFSSPLFFIILNV